jgi:FkbM family methyltransferase
MQLIHRDSTNLGATLRMLLGVFEPGTTRLIERVVKPGMVVIDVGAHVGYYTLLAASLVGDQGRVFAFEPDAGNYSLLLENINLNGHSCARAFRQAVADRGGSTSFFLSAWGSDRNSLYQDNSGLEAQRVEVEAVTLDDFLAAAGNPIVDLVKMDIEGAELVALQGMKETLKRTRRLILEFSPLSVQASPSNPEELLDMLSRHGFSIQIIQDDGSLKPLESIDFSRLVGDLIRTKNYVNLFCEKRETLSERMSALTASSSGLPAQ